MNILGFFSLSLYMKAKEKDLNIISGSIIETAIGIHKRIGPGLLESAYEKIMAYELCRKGFAVERQVKVPLRYDKLYLPDSYRMDLLINNCVIIELKSIKRIEDIHKKQLLTYLRLTEKPLGLIINFNEVLLKDGIKRIKN